MAAVLRSRRLPWILVVVAIALVAVLGGMVVRLRQTIAQEHVHAQRVRGQAANTIWFQLERVRTSLTVAEGALTRGDPAAARLALALSGEQLELTLQTVTTYQLLIAQSGEGGGIIWRLLNAYRSAPSDLDSALRTEASSPADVAARIAGLRHDLERFQMVFSEDLLTMGTTPQFAEAARLFCQALQGAPENQQAACTFYR